MQDRNKKPDDEKKDITEIMLQQSTNDGNNNVQNKDTVAPDENGFKIVERNKNRKSNNRSVVILGDSIVKGVQAYKIKKL